MTPALLPVFAYEAEVYWPSRGLVMGSLSAGLLLINTVVGASVGARANLLANHLVFWVGTLGPLIAFPLIIGLLPSLPSPDQKTMPPNHRFSVPQPLFPFPKPIYPGQSPQQMRHRVLKRSVTQTRCVWTIHWFLPTPVQVRPKTLVKKVITISLDSLLRAKQKFLIGGVKASRCVKLHAISMWIIVLSTIPA